MGCFDAATVSEETAGSGEVIVGSGMFSVFSWPSGP
jgi:hypothetical protein